MAAQPPAQSPFVSSSGAPQQEEDEESRRPWDEDDFGDEVLDLTGGIGGFSHPPFTVHFATEPPALAPKDEEESSKPVWEEAREDSPQPSAPEDEVPPDRRPTAPAITPLAPLQPAAPSKEQAPPRRGPSGSADETLFALPAASASLTRSSAEHMMDWQEQPYSSLSPGQEEFTSLLHETSASLPSLSPLSAYPVKDHAFTDGSLAQSPLAGVFQEPLSNLYLESVGDSLHVEKTETRDYLKLEQTETQPPLQTLLKPEAMIVDHIENEVVCATGTEHVKQITPPRQEMILLAESSKEVLFSEPVKTGESGADEHAFKVACEEESPVRAEYADFKPFAPVLESRIVHQEASTLDDIFKSDVNSIKEVDIDVLATEYYHEMDTTSAYPESVQDPSQAYITSATFQTIESADDDAVRSRPPQHDLISENKTDEKKISEMVAQFNTEQSSSTGTATSHFAGDLEGREADYVTTDSSSKTSAATVTSMSESLTPDLVQEACESEMHDAAGAQLTYTSTIDLVQTSESSPEPSVSAGQISPSFECMESMQSPVLPDIVMEAPLSTGAVGIETSLYVSPLKDTALLGHEEQIKLECEKPPSYEDAMKVPLTQVQKDNGDSTAFKGLAHVESAALEEIEAPYISIACDLIKGTRISNESLPPDFTDFSKNVLGDFASQSEHTKIDEDSSPESEEIDFYRQWGPEVVKKEVAESVASSREEKAAEAMSYSITGDENKAVFTDLSPGKAYMESIQPEFDLSKDTTAFLLHEPTVAISSKEEKPLQMEELGNVIYSEQDLSGYEEHKRVSPFCTGEQSPSPIIEDFMTTLAHSKADKLVLGTDNEMGRKDINEYMRKGNEVEARQVPCPEITCEASPLKDLPVNAEGNLKTWEYSPDSRAVHVLPKEEVPAVHVLPKEEVPAVHVLPKEEVPAVHVLPKEEVGGVKSKDLAREVNTEHSSSEEKREQKKDVLPVAAASVLSAELGKASVVDLLYWQDIKKTGVVFGASLFLLLSLSVFSIVSVSAYIALALLSVTISYRIYKGVFQAIQKSDEGHPFRAYLENDVAVSEELVQKYSNVALGHINCTTKELRRLFLVEDLVDSLKFAVLMWVFTYVGALFNGLTLLILALISLFSIPVIYERHQTQIDHYFGLVNKSVKDAVAKIQAKIPGLKRKAE